MKNFTFSLILLFLIAIPNIGQSQTIATYTFSFESDWNSMDHGMLPGNAHWSNLVGATHKNANEFMQLGVNATTGIKNVAELGNNVAFMSEVNSAITAGDADQWLQKAFDAPNDESSGATIMTVSVTEEFHLISLVSMIAPSPDWFIAVNSLDLRNAGNTAWRTTFTIDVFAYDSGTDAGTNYTSADNPNTPVGIFMINGSPINGLKMGTLTATLDDVLGIETPSFSNSLSLSPNPASDFLTLRNSGNTAIQGLSVYNVLGNLVSKMEVNSSESAITIPLNQLNSGLYLVKIEGQNGQTVTKKVIVQ